MGAILVERKDGVVTVTLNRPERRNALDVPTWHAAIERDTSTHSTTSGASCASLPGATGRSSASAAAATPATARTARVPRHAGAPSTAAARTP